MSELQLEAVRQPLPVVRELRYRQPPRPPVYPKLALRRRQQGEAWVRARVNARGITEAVELLQSSGFELLDQSALSAVQGWQFAAAERDGVAIAAWVEVPVAFEIHRR